MLLCNTCEKTEEEVKIIKSKMLCQSCNNREYYENNKERLRKVNKENKENNKEKVKEYNKKYYENNKENLCRDKREYYENNKDNIKEYNKEYYENNKETVKEYRRKYDKDNKEQVKENKCKYYKENKEKINKSSRKYYENNKEKMIEYRKEYYENNKEKIIESNRKYVKYKLDNDVLYKLKHNTRNLIRTYINKNGYSKNSRTHEILGCSFEEFKLYLESKFESWMNWDNQGLYNGELNYGWDIDHKIPLSSAKTEEDIIKLNHYSNLQPLCSKINRDIKRDNII